MRTRVGDNCGRVTIFKPTREEIKRKVELNMDEIG